MVRIHAFRAEIAGMGDLVGRGDKHLAHYLAAEASEEWRALRGSKHRWGLSQG
jgi:hypothetical protein